MWCVCLCHMIMRLCPCFSYLYMCMSVSVCVPAFCMLGGRWGEDLHCFWNPWISVCPSVHVAICMYVRSLCLGVSDICLHVFLSLDVHRYLANKLHDFLINISSSLRLLPLWSGPESCLQWEGLHHRSLKIHFQVRHAILSLQFSHTVTVTARVFHLTGACSLAQQPILFSFDCSGITSAALSSASSVS